MLDGLGMTETTPGPLIMVLQFVGFLAAYRDAGWASPLLAGTVGGLLATWVTFAPCFAWVFLGAPFIERLRGNRALSAALTAVSAAVVGVILNLAVCFAIHVIFREVRAVEVGTLSLALPVPGSINWLAALLAGAARFAVFRLKLGMAAVLSGWAARWLDFDPPDQRPREYCQLQRIRSLSARNLSDNEHPVGIVAPRYLYLEILPGTFPKVEHNLSTALELDHKTIAV